MTKHKIKSKAKKERQKRKEANRKAGAILDTSFQIERLKYEKEFAANLNTLSSTHDIYTSYFVLYEFKIGLIYSLINFYFLVQLYEDPSKALMKLSDARGREPKDQLIIQALLQRVNQSINTTDIKKYLRNIEFLILYCQQIFSDRLRGLVGNFDDDPIIAYKIESSEDYKGFTELYQKRKSIPLDTFWIENMDQLKLLIASTDLKSNYTDMFEKLEQILVDAAKANNFFVNKKIGDAVIAVDCPPTFTVATIDNSFSSLCPLVNKKFIKYDKVKL